MISLNRVCGLETEYGVNPVSLLSPPPPEPPLGVEEAVKCLFASTQRAVRVPHSFLSNGGRLYVDIGSHPEFASPECFTVEDLVAQDAGGDELLNDLTVTANEGLSERKIRIHLLKCNQDTWGNTFGCHENYQTYADKPLDHSRFVSFLAARQILTGSGFLNADGEFLFSSRAEHLQNTTSADPTHARAFVNVRQEPHADADKWGRLHVTCVDSSMSGWSTALKVFLGDRVLTCLERGKWDDDLELCDPVEAVRVWNRNPLAKVPGTGRTREWDCVDFLKRSLDRISELDQDTGEYLELARRGITDLETIQIPTFQREALRNPAVGDSLSTNQELDWSIKLRLLARLCARHEKEWQSWQLRRVELAFHDISHDAGLRFRLRKSGLIRPLVADVAIESAKRTPPAGTRAVGRGKVVELCEQTGRSLSVGWAHLRLDNPPSPQIDILDPQIPAIMEVEKLLSRLKQLGSFERLKENTNSGFENIGGNKPG